MRLRGCSHRSAGPPAGQDADGIRDRRQQAGGVGSIESGRANPIHHNIRQGPNERLWREGYVEMAAVSPHGDNSSRREAEQRRAPSRRPAPIVLPRRRLLGRTIVSSVVAEIDGQRLPRGERPLTRTTTAAERAAARSRPQHGALLEVVPRRRRAVGVFVVACAVLFALLLGAVAFQTKLAQNQLALDTTERAVRDARERYDVLRRQRAQLRSPNRLAVEAERLGMVPAETGDLMILDPILVASVAASASGLPTNVFDDHGSSLDQFGEVKAVTGKTP